MPPRGGRTRWSSASIRNLTYARLAAANDCIRAGALFIATNRDPVYPTERGLRPGAGSLVVALEYATGVTPISIGKPAPYLLEAAARAVGREPSEAIMIGDVIPTDLMGARAVGARCVFMLTGVTNRAQVEALPPDEAPTAIAADAAELAANDPGAARAVEPGVPGLARGGPRAPGCPRPIASNSVRSGASLASSAKATSSACDGRSPTAPERQPDLVERPSYSSESEMSETVSVVRLRA